jgi:spore germination protein YaaH
MRTFGLTLLSTALVIACTPNVSEPAGIIPSSVTPPTTTAVDVGTTTTANSALPIELIIDEVEALAVDGGIRLEVRDDTGRFLGWLERDHPQLVVGPSTRRVTVRYHTAEGRPTDVVWEQSTELPMTTIAQPWRGQGECAATLPDGSSAPVALVWQSGGNSTDYIEQLDRADGVVNVVSPVWWRMAADGHLAGSADPGYVDAVRDRNVAIWPAVAGFDADVHHAVFSDPDRRSALAQQLSNEAERIGADGVNIDIEGYRAGDAQAFLVWVEELADLVRDWGGVVSLDLVPRSDTWDVGPEDLSFWSNAPLRTELAAATDCTILMAYDQHNRYRPAGPVAAPPWVEEVLGYALRHVDPAQLVLGVPFYGRIWDPAELGRPTAVGIGELSELLDEGEIGFDPAYGIDRIDMADGRFFWAETPRGLEHRFELMEDYGLAGWAAWRFGFDSPEVWDVVRERR